MIFLGFQVSVMLKEMRRKKEWWYFIGMECLLSSPPVICNKFQIVYHYELHLFTGPVSVSISSSSSSSSPLSLLFSSRGNPWNIYSVTRNMTSRYCEVIFFKSSLFDFVVIRMHIYRNFNHLNSRKKCIFSHFFLFMHLFYYFEKKIL